MRSASLHPASYRPRPGLARRAGAFLLAVGINCLLVWLLMRLGILPPLDRPPPTAITSFDVTEGAAQSVDAPARTAERTRDAGGSAAAPAPPRPRPPDQPLPEPEPPAVFPSSIRLVSRTDFAGGDLSRAPRALPGIGAGPATGAAAGAETASIGEGPGGVRLYPAEWYREPTDAEIAPYMPRRRPAQAWAMIACRTVAGNRVEDCQELGESQAGAGLARGLRQAAWQFRVLPPRVNGRPQVGEWVRIRFDFTVREGEGAGE